MILLMLLFILVMYIVLALLFVSFVKNITDIKLFKWMAVAFVILLPTWDVVLGYVVYYPACFFIPKTAIYETAETDCIYYEGVNNEVYNGELNYNNTVEQVEKVNDLNFMFGRKKVYRYFESKVIKRRDNIESKTIRINPIIYRCISLPKEREDFIPEKCFKAEKADCSYMVKESVSKIGATKIYIKRVYNRTKNKLIAETSLVHFSGFNGGIILLPFFNWMDWGWGVGVGSMSYPEYKFYNEFEFEILKPKK